MLVKPGSGKTCLESPNSAEMWKYLLTWAPNLSVSLLGSKSVALSPLMASRDSFWVPINMGFPSGSDSNESAFNAGDQGLTPGLGRSPGEWNGNPL